MKTKTILAVAAAACLPAFAQQPAQPQPAPQPQQQKAPASAAQSIINQMGITTNALVDVLQGVTDKATADAAAREVGEIIVQLKLLNDLAGYAPDFAQDIEAMRQAQVNALMPMLMNTNPCYGSEAMLKALAPVVTIRHAQPQEQAQPEPQPQHLCLTRRQAFQHGGQLLLERAEAYLLGRHDKTNCYLDLWAYEEHRHNLSPENYTYFLSGGNGLLSLSQSMIDKNVQDGNSRSRGYFAQAKNPNCFESWDWGSD